MAYLLFAVFLGVPLVEIALFILIGGQIGVLATMAAVVLTAVAGALLVRHQGIATLEKARRQVNQDRIPAGALGEGLAILLAGAVLLTPGFFTDVIGFALLVPPVRRWLVRLVGRWLGPRLSVIVSGHGTPREPDRGPIIDGEAVEIDEDAPRDPNPHSPWRKH